jgi:hypothetical protein
MPEYIIKLLKDGWKVVFKEDGLVVVGKDSDRCLCLTVNSGNRMHIIHYQKE